MLLKYAQISSLLVSFLSIVYAHAGYVLDRQLSVVNKEIVEKLYTVYPELKSTHFVSQEEVSHFFNMQPWNATRQADFVYPLIQKATSLIDPLSSTEDHMLRALIVNTPALSDAREEWIRKAFMDYLCGGQCAPKWPSLNDWEQEFQILHQSYPSEFFPLEIGKTREGRPLTAFVFPSDNEAAPTIWFDGAIHGNEPFGIAVVLDAMRVLASRNSSAIRTLRSRFHFACIPIVNPDGYDISTTKIDWRKNAFRDKWGTLVGVDLNRNFPSYWTSSESPSFLARDMFKDTFPGDKPASEPETQAIQAFARHLEPVLSLHFHTNGHAILIPDIGHISWSDWLVYRGLGFLFKHEIRDEFGHSKMFSIGRASTLLNHKNGYIVGSHSEWMWNEFKTFSFTVELLSEKPSYNPWPYDSLVREKGIEGARRGWMELLLKSHLHKMRKKPLRFSSEIR